MTLRRLAFRAAHPPYKQLIALRLRLRRERFMVGGTSRPLFIHPYNETWQNERAVEVPLARAFLDSEPALEVGNVLGHYGRRGHVVVDKYERARGVLNADVLDYAPATRFARIAAISTLEHVGFDEEVRDLAKCRRAIEHLATLLAAGGRLWVSMPIGYNPGADACWAPAAGLFDEVTFLRRAGRFDWREATWDEVREVPYDRPFPSGNAIGVGIRAA
jgi:hypothetical protein